MIKIALVIIGSIVFLILFFVLILYIQWFVFIRPATIIIYKDKRLIELHPFFKYWGALLLDKKRIFIGNKKSARVIQLIKVVLKNSKRLDLKITRLGMKDKEFDEIHKHLRSTGYEIRERKSKKLKKLNAIIIPVEMNDSLYISSIANILKIIFRTADDDSFKIWCTGEFGDLNKGQDFIPATKEAKLGFFIGKIIGSIKIIFEKRWGKSAAAA